MVKQNTPKPQWYALYLRSRWEKKVLKELTIKSVECFLPLIREKHQWSDRSKYIDEPLFRGYIFVRTDLKNRIRLLETDGVLTIVGIRNTPSPIPEEQINWLRILTKHPDAVHRNTANVAGTRVRIIAGPFSGVEGTIVFVKGSTRLVVSIDAIQKSIIVDVSSDITKPVEKINHA
jgi:transcription antitermination factor NusG